MRVTLNKEDIELIVKALYETNYGHGVNYLATVQRVNEILKKLKES